MKCKFPVLLSLFVLITFVILPTKALGRYPWATVSEDLSYFIKDGFQIIATSASSIGMGGAIVEIIYLKKDTAHVRCMTVEGENIQKHECAILRSPE